MKTKVSRNSSGFTLIEIMIALFVASLAIVAYVGTNIIVHRSTEEMHERTIAIQNANQVIERMRNTTRTVSFPSGLVAAFPDGGAVAGFNNLANEQVTVSYDSTTANPLNVTVTVGWLSYGGRQSTKTVQTYITQR